MGPLARVLFGCLALTGCARLSGFEPFAADGPDGTAGGGGNGGTGGGGTGGGGTGGGNGGASGAGLPAWPDHCFDGKRDADESDVDCGGSCARCARDRACNVAADCWNDACLPDGTCSNGCPVGMSSISLGDGKAFCIDEYEVTQEEYRAFVTKTPSRYRQDPVCAVRNDSFDPHTSSPITTTRVECTKNAYRPAETPKRPVTCVDHCDAVAYCREQHKFLCGEARLPGVILEGVNFDGVDAFYVACTTGDPANTYPYGDAYAPKTCNTKDYGSPTTVDVGTASACRNKASAACFHLVGNVAEWSMACVPGDGVGPPDCLVRGGSFIDGATTSRCTSWDSIRSTDAFADVGFRCCG